MHRQLAAHPCILQATLELPAEVVAGISEGLFSYQGWINMRHPQQSGALDSHQLASWQTGQAVHQLQDITWWQTTERGKMLFSGLGWASDVWMFQGDVTQGLPQGCVIVG
jgi:hypothetical protein